jgi:electron transfer flavoprotein alpha subunit
MSGGVLVVAEHLRGGLREVTREVVTAGAELKESCGGRLAVALIAKNPRALVETVSLAGVDEVVQVPVADNEFIADVWAGAVEGLVRDRGPALVLSGFTANGMAMGPAVAVHLGLGFASDVVACSIEGGDIVARREFYGGKVEAELGFPAGSPVLLLLRPTIWAQAVLGGSPLVTSFVADAPRIRSQHRELLDPPADGLDISKADIVLAVGRGVGERENIARLEAFADKIGATLAASRPLVDAGWLPQWRQVGQSGVTVKPKLYLAFGISGAAQHVVGMKASQEIVAVNKDPKAPIFSVAHYGAVADLFNIVDELDRLW